MATPIVLRARAFVARPGVTKRLVTDAAKLGVRALDRLDDDEWQPSAKATRLLEGALDRLDAALA